MKLLEKQKKRSVFSQAQYPNKLKAIGLLMSLICYSLSSCVSAQNRYSSLQLLQTETKMQKILIIGMDPHTIDFTSPEIPQGLTAERIEQGLKTTITDLKESGFEAEMFLIEAGNDDLSMLANHLRAYKFDGIVIGNGIRGLQSNFTLFERIVNQVHTSAPDSKIIFNSLPTDTVESVKRWL